MYGGGGQVPGVTPAARDARESLDVDKARMPEPQPLRERADDIDLEPASEHDLAVAHHPGLQARIAQLQPDHEPLWTRGGLEHGGRGRLPVIGSSGSGQPEGNEHDGGDDRRADHAEDQAEPARERTECRAGTQVASQNTCTGVPYCAKPYSICASGRLTRTQPWEAAYVGTEAYSWNANPPVK
jgi:hypothetical protein